jgi:DNA-binding transcriptional LysR family regulator
MLDVRDLDLNLLLVFHEIHRERQISAAAKRLRLSQSAVSNALARLRTALGDDLFVRTAQGMQPTPLAERMAEPVALALGQVALALNRSERFEPASSTRRFTIAMTDVGEVYFLAPLIEQCRALAPGVEIAAVRAGAALKDDLEAGRIDLAIGPFDHVSEALVRRRLFSQPYVTLCAADHPLAHGPVDLPRFLAAEHLFVASADSPYDRINLLLEKAGVRAAARYQVPQFLAVPYIVSGTRLLVTVPQKLAQRAAGPFGLAWFTPPLKLPPLQTNIFWHRRYGQDPGGLWLRTLVAETFLED